jgi:hypothetical protein
MREATMKPSTLTLLLLVFVSWPTVAMAGDWYVHRTNHQMSVPPWYCYCYRIAKASVLPGTVTYPMDMQITEAQALSKLATYAALPETCANNCGFGAASPGGGGGGPGVPPPTGPVPSLECQEFAKVGGCAGFCKGMIAGHEDAAGVSIAKCTADCLEKFHCER